jgi:clan AA aspartic protease (TIGR02281 family)
VSKDFAYSFALIFSIVLTLAGGGFGYWYFWIRHDFGPVYAQLGISALPLHVEAEADISKRLEQLAREPCYKDGVAGLADALVTAGYPRDADTGLQNFAKRCGDSDALRSRRHQALSKASDYTGALTIANDLIASDPTKAIYRYMRGQTYEQLKNFQAALNDYLVSLQLSGTPARVAGFVFYDIARMHATLGRFCDAITAVETFVAFDPATRRTQQSVSKILEYSKQGNCGIDYARGSAKVALRGAEGVRTLAVSVNGVGGNFIIDTGATYLSVTTDFFDKAKMTRGAGERIPMKTVGGNVQAALGTAGTVAVGTAVARNVTVAVIADARDPFGPRIDGLLGMSFLARFNTRITANGIELTAAQPADAADVMRNLSDAGAAPTPAPATRAR